MIESGSRCENLTDTCRLEVSPRLDCPVEGKNLTMRNESSHLFNQILSKKCVNIEATADLNII